MPIIFTQPAAVGWEQKTSAPFSGTAGHRPMWLLPDDTVLVGASGTFGVGLEVAIYTPSTDSWVQKNDVPTGLSTPMPLFHPVSGKPVVTGDSTPYDIYEYTSGTDTWTLADNWTVNHRNCGFANLNNGDVIAISSQWTAQRLLVTSWDGSSFSVLDPIPTPVAGDDIQGRNVAFTADNGDVYTMGFYGYLPSGPNSDQIYKYEPTPTNNMNLIAEPMPAEFYSPSYARLSGNRVMIIGGIDSGGFRKEVYIFDMDTETFTQFPYDFASPAVPGGLPGGLTTANHAVTLADGRVMSMTNDNDVYITVTAP